MRTTSALPVSLFLLLCAAPALVSQAPKPLAGAAESITEQDVIRHIKVIADDSMLGRDTPSRGLDLTAQYVADRFKSFGLVPGGEDGTWFQRYPIRGRKTEPAKPMACSSCGRPKAARRSRPRPGTSRGRY